MRADPQLQRIPVVVVTASTHADDRARAEDHGVAGYLVKPFSTAMLQSAMAAAMNCIVAQA